MMLRATMLFLAVLAAGVLYADRGSISYLHGAKIFEPNQRALIAWNEKTEILILSTDLQASTPTKVLEVIPMPAEPKVTKSDIAIFRKATDLLNRKLREMHVPLWTAHPLSKGMSRGAVAPEPAGKVTFHEKIGAHNIAVTKVNDAAGFTGWVEHNLKSAGVSAPEIPAVLKQTIAEYLHEGFGWFVFDEVQLGTAVKTNDALQYRFASKRLFYPTKISRTDTGPTTVDLMILSPRLLNQFPGIPFSQVHLPAPPVTITSRELRDISREMDTLLGCRTLKLRVWRLRGDLAKFDKDLIALP